MGALAGAAVPAGAEPQPRDDVRFATFDGTLSDGAAAEAFRDEYLSVSQSGTNRMNDPHNFVAPVNTEIASGRMPQRPCN